MGYLFWFISKRVAKNKCMSRVDIIICKLHIMTESNIEKDF